MKRLWTLASLGGLLAVPVLAQENVTAPLGFGGAGPSTPGAFAIAHFPPPPGFGCDGPGSFPGPMMPMLMNDLSDSQVEQLVQQKKEFLANEVPKRTKIEQLHFELLDALSQPSVYAVRIMELNSRINGLKNELATAEVQRQIKAAESMTVEQRRKMRRSLLMMPPLPPPGPAVFRMQVPRHEPGPGNAHPSGDK